MHPNCEWLDRVSSYLDGELPPEEHPLVERHLARCPDCTSIVHHSVDLKEDASRTSQIAPRLLTTRSPVLMALVALFGVLNVIVALPNFIKGNTMGDEMHALRHLAIWQSTLGFAVLAVARNFQFSRFVKVVSFTFLIATSSSSIYDLINGHSGPWADPAHLLEMGALIMILVISRPQSRMLTRARNMRLNQTRS